MFFVAEKQQKTILNFSLDSLAANLRRQKEADANPKPIQQIEFIRQLKEQGI